MTYQTLNWDSTWATVYKPFHDAHVEFDNNMGDMPAREFSKLEAKLDREETKYDRYCFISASCKLYAERLLSNMAKKYPKLQFASHSDPFGFPANVYWRLLVRSSTGKAVSAKVRGEVTKSAHLILKNIEKKYPDEAENVRSAAEAATWKAFEKEHGARVKHVDGGVEVRVPSQQGGCASMLLTVIAVFFLLLVGMVTRQ